MVWSGWSAMEEMEDGWHCRWRLGGGGNNLKHEAQIRPQNDLDLQKECLVHEGGHSLHVLGGRLVKVGSSRGREVGRVGRVD